MIGPALHAGPINLQFGGPAMSSHSRSNLITGLIFLAFAALVAFVWVPLDVETGLVEKVRRRIMIGDSLAPTLAAFFIGLGGLVLVLFERSEPDQPSVKLANVTFIATQIFILVVGFLIMLYAGPLAVSLFNGDAEYRLLRDTAPWKYIGYFLGGIFIVAGLISQSEGRMSLRSVVIAVGVVVVLTIIYDVPFEDLLLPPNGDV